MLHCLKFQSPHKHINIPSLNKILEWIQKIEMLIHFNDQKLLYQHHQLSQYVQLEVPHSFLFFDNLK